MKVTLKLGYKLHGNQIVCVESDGVNIPLQQCSREELTCELNLNSNSIFEYNYAVLRDDCIVRKEWGGKRRIPIAKGVESLFVNDSWREMSPNAPLYSSLFTASIFRRCAPVHVALESGCLMVEVSVPTIKSSQVVVMVGSSQELGAWDVASGVVMADGDHPVWRTPSLKISGELLSSEFKFVIVDSATDEVVAWEQGANRSLAKCRGVSQDSIYVVEHEPQFAVEAWRGAGVAIPLFSLRSEQSMGVGEFSDLKLMVDWARMTGQQIIQILPINDTTMSGTWEDSYPYNANSIFALHPQYISLKEVGSLKDKELQAQYEQEGARLNALPAVDYEAVNNLKNSYLKQLYTESGAKTFKKREYKKFFEENSYWLESYALFSLLRDKYSSANSALWGSESLYSEALMASYRDKKPEELGYYYFVQYHLHSQLLAARAYALTNGVAFKGDIPIGVSRTSVDVWVNPCLFRLDSQAGAPPDDFSVMGQNWGFPTYNWEEMSLDGYAWWQARFSKMSEYFDAYRIDHILGFFRIWEIPLDAIHGLLGYFNPALPFTPLQMRERYGFTFEKCYAEPAINGWLLYHIFGSKAEEIIQTYLHVVNMDSYCFREEYNTQAKIALAVEDKELRESLLSLFCEVLFIEDPHKTGHFHPRISAHSTFKYQAMNDYDKECYNRLYNDFYYHLHNAYWQEEALKKLPSLISATNMLTCGEDLGMIPDCVPYVMSSEQILSLEIQRMPKDPSLLFGEPWHYPYRSVCTTSTHDMNPIRAWLLEDQELSDRYFREILGVNYSMESDCEDWVCEHIVRQHLTSPSMWTILPLQDWLSISRKHRGVDPQAERINVPANSRHYWRYRMHCTIEELIAANDLNDKIGALVRMR
ncbi:MAG: 4-alpha-glucanotransferase [Rikenellaceae bacterium]